ncbi:MAG TPA: ABC transporter permease, partial [Myxococcales bacterium]|nr:ABC transporter permease [Myxococcales bacterium]
MRQDVRAALRLLLRAPGFAAVVVVTLALAIGATTSVFSVVRGLLLKPLPYRDPDKLVRLHGSFAQYSRGSISHEEYREDYEHLATVSVAAWGYGSGSLAGASSSEHIGLGRATSSLLPVLGVQPMLGRWFTRDEENPGNSNVVVLGHALWQRRFGGDPQILGQTIQISGRPFRVIGVLADELELPESFDAWRPLPFPADRLGAQNRSNRSLRVIGRLAPAKTLADLRSELDVISARLRAAYPNDYPKDVRFRMSAYPLLGEMVRSVRLTLWMLFAAVVLVLLMACANVGNLMLARGTARERELAVRAALGAGRGRLVRQMLVESVILALVGGAVGMFAAIWGVDLLLALGPRNLPRVRHVRVDALVLAFAVGVSLVSGILFGLLPALTATETNVQDALRGASASSARRPRRLRRVLVAADVALALTLVSGAVLL